MLKTKAEIRSSGYWRLSDEALIHRYVHRHDEVAVHCLFDRYGHLVYGICHKYMGKTDPSVRATLHLFTRLLDDLKKYPVEQFQPWLFRATVNYCLAQLRKSAGADLPAQIINEMEPGAAPAMPESGIACEPDEAALGELPEEQRVCIGMFYLKRMTYTRISAATGLTAAQVRDLIRNGRKNLLRSLAAEGNMHMSHLLDTVFKRSACLTKRQVKDYITGVMAEEECYVAEVHLSSCTFCHEAVEGLLPAGAGSLEALQELNSDFIREHIRKTTPQIHLNSIAPAAPADGNTLSRHHRGRHAWWRMMPVAVALALAFFLLRNRRPQAEQMHHPQQEKAMDPVSPQVLPEGRSKAAPASTAKNMAGSTAADINESSSPLSAGPPVPPPADNPDIAKSGEPRQPQLLLAAGEERDSTGNASSAAEMRGGDLTADSADLPAQPRK